jgi:hypothetical protein
MQNEVYKRLKFLRFYKMTEKTACQKKHYQKIFGKGRKITNDVCNKHTLSKIVPAANYLSQIFSN